MTRSPWAVLVLLFTLAGCNGHPRAFTVRAGNSPIRVSGDGRYFGYVRAVNPTDLTLSFDVAETLTGEAANRAAEQDGVIAPGERVPNDHYERNRDKTTREYPVAPDARVIALGRTGPHRGNVRDFLAAFADKRPKSLYSDYRGARSQYWFTIRDGLVVRIDEQYFP